MATEDAIDRDDEHPPEHVRYRLKPTVGDSERLIHGEFLAQRGMAGHRVDEADRIVRSNAAKTATNMWPPR